MLYTIYQIASFTMTPNPGLKVTVIFKF